MIKNKKYPITFIIGTRPEAIKMAPVILEFQKSGLYLINIVLSGQHDDMIKPVMEVFNLKENINFNVLKNCVSLEQIISKILEELNKLFSIKRPSIVFVQGDTISAFAGALSAFLHKIPIAHIEAGLRTDNIYAPFPEEANRRMISQISTFHFAPTKVAYENLLRNGVKDNVFISGNTVVDALELVSKRKSDLDIKGLDIDSDRFILTTIHRRENWGEPLKNIARGILKFSNQNKHIKIILPLHKNPLVREPLQNILGNQKNIILVDAIPYLEFIILLKRSSIVLTDSGGIQEEAVTLGKPILILRECTERPEVFSEGNACLVGTDPEKIYSELNSIIRNENKHNSMAKKSNTFGDGNSSKLVFEKISKFLADN